MARTPKSRNSEPKTSGTTIDIDPKDVKRIDASTPEDGKSVTPAEAKPAAATSEVAAEEPAPKAAEAEKAKTEAPKTDPAQPDPAKSEPAKSEPKPAAESSTSRPDDKPKAQAATPSAFATKPAGSAPAAAAASTKDRRGGSALMGGVIGGLIVLALGAGLQAAGIWPAAEPAEDGRVAGLQTEIEALRGDINQLRAASGNDAALEERLAALETAVADAGNAPDAEAVLAEVEQRLTSADDASASNASRLDAIEQRLADLDTRLAAAEETSPGERVIAASALKSAIDRGQPFGSELDAYATLGGTEGAVEELRPYAEEGVPTRAQINSEVEEAARAMNAAASSVDENAGLMDRLAASARSLVQVRPVGMAEGEGAGAAVARLEASVRQDDYARAISEYESLPQEAQAAGADFMEKVRARHAADRLIDEALSAALQDS